MPTPDNNNRRNTGRRNRVIIGGAPAIVILEPPSEYTTINIENSYDLKLWVVNRAFFYTKKQGHRNWRCYWNSLEGFTTTPDEKWDKKYPALKNKFKPVKAGEHKVFFSQKFISSDQLNSSHSSLVPPDVITFPATQAPIPIPYPNMAKGEKNKIIKTTELKGGVKVIKILLSSIKYSFSERDLDYWVKIFLNNSKDQQCIDYREHGQDKTNKDVTDFIKRKAGALGSPQAFIKTLGNGQPPTAEYFPGNTSVQENCILFGSSVRSQLTQETQGGSLNSGKNDKNKVHIDSNMEIRKMDSTATKAISKINSFDKHFSYFKEIFDSKLQQLNDKNIQYKNFDHNIKEVNNVLNNALKQTIKDKSIGIDIKTILNYFAIYNPDSSIYSSKENSMRGIAEIIDRTARKKAEATKGTKKNESTKKGEAPCITSWKKVYFASGSDAFSEELVPKHVFSQIKGWWDNLDKGRKEFLLNCSYIEVIGFASKKGHNPVNRRLRDDRAWKTAKSLQLIFKKEKNGVIPELQEKYPGDHIKVPNKQTIFHGPENLHTYPGTKESEEIVTITDLSKRTSDRADGDDSKDDRCAKIIFHSYFSKPQKGEKKKVQYIFESYSLTVLARRIAKLAELSISYKSGSGTQGNESTNYRNLMYLCPAEFNDA